jgi:PST family polysaccharide transporter
MKSLAKALAFFSGAQFVTMLVQLGKGKLGALILGPAGVGVLSQLTYMWNLFHTMTGLGFQNGLIRRVAQCESDGDFDGLRAQLSTTIGLLTLVSVAFAILGAVFSSRISDLLLSDGGDHATLVAVILVSLPLAINARIFRGVLSGLKKVKQIVRAQIVADVLSFFVFLVLVWKLNLTGAVISFVALQTLKLGFYFTQFKIAVTPFQPVFRPSYFSTAEIHHNASYGISGLLLVSVGIVTTLTISRWIIEQYGLADNGVFAVSWKVVTVYLGTLYASAGSYYFPLLASIQNDKELATQVNEAVKLYMYLIPLASAFLLLGGEFLFVVLFSSEFGYAAMLLFFLLPGDLFRICAETTGLSLLARKRLVSYSAVYLIWAACFLLLAWKLLPEYGLLGVAFAYLSSQVLNMCMALILVSKELSVKLTSRTILAFFRGLILLASISLVSWFARDHLNVVFAGVFLIALWLLASFRDDSFRQLAKSGFQRVKRNG